MIKKIIALACLCLFSIGLSYGVSKDFSFELQKENDAFNKTLNGLDKRARKEAILKKQQEYQDRIVNKQRELARMDKNKRAMTSKERKEKKQELRDEIENLHRAQKNLR